MKYVLSFLASLTAFSALAQTPPPANDPPPLHRMANKAAMGPENLAHAKQITVHMIDARIRMLQDTKSCVTAANAMPDLQACREKERGAMMAMREEAKQEMGIMRGKGHGPRDNRPEATNATPKQAKPAAPVAGIER